MHGVGAGRTGSVQPQEDGRGERRVRKGGRESGGTAENEGLSCPRMATRALPQGAALAGVRQTTKGFV